MGIRGDQPYQRDKIVVGVRSKDGLFQWKRIAPNGTILCKSGGFSDKRACLENLKRCMHSHFYVKGAGLDIKSEDLLPKLAAIARRHDSTCCFVLLG